jgi:hypothetical protein
MVLSLGMVPYLQIFLIPDIAIMYVGMIKGPKSMNSFFAKLDQKQFKREISHEKDCQCILGSANHMLFVF